MCECASVSGHVQSNAHHIWSAGDVRQKVFSPLHNTSNEVVHHSCRSRPSRRSAQSLSDIENNSRWFHFKQFKTVLTCRRRPCFWENTSGWRSQRQSLRQVCKQTLQTLTCLDCPLHPHTQTHTHTHTLWVIESYVFFSLDIFSILSWCVFQTHLAFYFLFFLSVSLRRRFHECCGSSERRQQSVDENKKRRSPYRDLAGTENYICRFDAGTSTATEKYARHHEAEKWCVDSRHIIDSAKLNPTTARSTVEMNESIMI